MCWSSIFFHRAAATPVACTESSGGDRVALDALRPPQLLTGAALEGEDEKGHSEPIGVGHTLPDMPLFLTPDHYIYVPLEPTYMAAWHSLPQRWRREIEPHSAPNPSLG